MKMKTNKPPGWDGIQVEFFKKGGYNLYTHLHELLKAM